MGIYFNGYNGRKYTFKVSNMYRIQECGETYVAVELLNLENLRKTRVSLDEIYSYDNTVEVGDIIERQYIRQGVGSYGGGFGGYSSSGHTYYTDLTSKKRAPKTWVDTFLSVCLILFLVWLAFYL